MPSYFISDLHLDASQPQTLVLFESFLSFIDNESGFSQSSLYILGDFFNAWIGDDEDDPFFTRVKTLLKQHNEQGLEIFFMRGNRDFLVGETLCGETGMTLLEDPTPLLPKDLSSRQPSTQPATFEHPILLMHGDTLCTDDVEYMAFRSQVRSQAWQQQVLALPLAHRRALAADLRAKSQSMTAMTPEDIMDINQQTLESVMEEHAVTTVIHGHTHRPKHHRFELNGKVAQRIVLGDWHDDAIYAKADHSGIHLQTFSLGVAE